LLLLGIVFENSLLKQQTMIQKILFTILLFSVITVIVAQDTIKGEIKPVKDYSWVILYQLKGAHQQYITNATVENGKFEMVIPKGKEKGIYRLFYDNKKNLYLDFIYNHENIDLTFHPDYPSVLVEYKTSDENKLYQNYLDKISDNFNALDSVQVEYFKVKDSVLENELRKFYLKKLKEVSAIQKTFEDNSKDKLAHHFIKANNRYYAKNLIKGTDQYLDTLRTHFFDYIDFNNSVLERSSFFMDRIIDYVTYLHTAEDLKKSNQLQKKAIQQVLKKIHKPTLKKDVIESLMYMFAQQENKDVTDFIMNNYYNKLPANLQDPDFKVMINDFFKTTIGQPAPQISWDVYGKKHDLYSLPDNDYYVVLFWSSSCSHCLKEVPKFNSYLKGQNITVIAIGLEDEISKDNWKELTFDLENIKYHILGFGKWKNKHSRNYGISATPSYFVLDKNKKIIAKPYDLKALQKFFEKESDSEKDKKEN
jgi:thiol-disulfide isomerase/thioredoxin